MTATVYILVCLLIGVITEALAARLGLWRYRLAWMRPFNVVVTFGLVYGGISWWFDGAGALWLFGVGAALGLVNEAANEYGFRAWYFPGRAVSWLRGNTAVVLIGLGWGLVPLIAVWLRDLLPAAALNAG